MSPLFEFLIKILPYLLFILIIRFSLFMSELKRKQEKKWKENGFQNQEKFKNHFKKICHLFWKYNVTVFITVLVFISIPYRFDFDSFGLAIGFWAFSTWISDFFYEWPNNKK